jgi:general secretion pathway protein A
MLLERLHPSKVQKGLRFSRQDMANHLLMNVTHTQPPWDNASPPSRTDERGPQKTEPQPIGGSRPKLLYERFGILENPFGVTPNPRYLYQSRTHAEARSSLIIGIQYRVGFQALIAPPGMGKTTILFNLLEQSRNVRTACLFQFQGDSRDLLRYLILELSGQTPDSNLAGMQDTLNQLLIREKRAGRQTIVIIDEAQNLDISVLETLRMLSNFETPSEKLLQIILAGQPQMVQRLATPELAQLYQRIPIRTTLIPFDLEDTRNYIEHRLRIAGYQGPPLFRPAAVQSIFERSGGVPREINTLCFNALLLATAAGKKQIDLEILHEVAADLKFNPMPFNPETPPAGIPDVRDAADPTATRIDKIPHESVPGAKAGPDDAVGDAALRKRPSLSTVDFGFSGWQTTKNATEIPASDRKTDVVTFVSPGVAGVSSCETEAAGTPTELPSSTPNRLDAEEVKDATTSLHQGRSSWSGFRGWISAIAALLILVLGSFMPRFAPPSISSEGPGKPSMGRIPQVAPSLTDEHSPTAVGQQSTGGTGGARDPFTTTQQDQRTANVTVHHATPGSRVRQTSVDKDPAPGTPIDKSSGKLPTEVVEDIAPARLIHMVKPIYPPAAVDAQIQGNVVLQVTGRENGEVRHVRFVSGPSILAPAAIDAVQKWRFRPADRDGQPVEWEMPVTVTFRLR